MIEDLFRVILRVPPSQKKIQADLSFMYQEVKPWADQIIPFDEEDDLEILSLNQDTRTVKQTFDKVLKGVFYSIYNEPMLVFAYKNYIKGAIHDLLYVKAYKLELIYRVRKSGIQIYLNRRILGKATFPGLLYGGKNNRLLGRIRRDSAQYYSIILWDKEVGQVLDPKSVDRVNPRAFTILEKMDAQEEQLFMTLGFLKIIERSNDFGWEHNSV